LNEACWDVLLGVADLTATELPHYGLVSIKAEEIYDGSSLIGGSHGDGTASASVIELLSL
jgi:hypothetical protein